MTNEEIRKLLSRPTITAAELADSGIFPLGRNGIYDAIKNGKIDVVDLGRKKAIVCASLRKQLGLDA
jgi:hypothetical protein